MRINSVKLPGDDNDARSSTSDSQTLRYDGWLLILTKRVSSYTYSLCLETLRKCHPIVVVVEMTKRHNCEWPSYGFETFKVSPVPLQQSVETCLLLSK